MKRFINLSKIESLAIYPEVVFNATRLLEISRLAGESKDYGIATSLSILSSEEFVKAFVLFLHGIGIDIYAIKEVKGVFSKHKTKHEISTLIEILNLVQTIFAKNINKGNTPFGTKPNLLKSALTLLVKAALNIGPIIELSTNLSWWGKADTLKNKGLYVDYLDTLVLPKNITEENFTEAYKISQELHEKIDIIKSHYENLTVIKRENLIKDINDGILFHNTVSKK